MNQKSLSLAVTDLYEVGHGEVHDVVFPGQLQDHVWVEQVVALEQAGGEAVVSLVLQEICQQVLQSNSQIKQHLADSEFYLSNFSIFRLSCVLHSIFEKVVLQQETLERNQKGIDIKTDGNYWIEISPGL